MKLNSIEYFIAVAECGSVSAAARRLYIAQPSLTKALHALERELGFELFERASSGMVLTEAGRKMLPEAKLVAQYCRGWKSLSGLADIRHISVYNHISLAGFLVPDIILRFRKRYPSVDITCFTETSPEKFISTDAEKPSLVFSICSESAGRLAFHTPGIVRRVIAGGTYGCLVSRKSRLAGKESVSFEELKEYFLALPNFVLESLPEADQSQTAIMDFLPKLIHTIPPEQIIEVDTVSNVIESARKYPDVYALSFAPAHRRYAGVQTGELVYVPLREQEVSGSICLLYPVQVCRQSLVVKELVEAVCEDSLRFFQGEG